jgi:hypothetical protein
MTGKEDVPFFYLLFDQFHLPYAMKPDFSNSPEFEGKMGMKCPAPSLSSP